MARKSNTPKPKKKDFKRHFPADVSGVVIAPPPVKEPLPAQPLPVQPSSQRHSRLFRKFPKPDRRVAAILLAAVLVGAGLVYVLIIRPSGADTDCGSERACFYEAYQTDCQANAIKKEVPSFEGDPIYLEAVLARQNDNCQVSVNVDTSQTLYGPSEIQTYTCTRLMFVDGASPQLRAEGCSGYGNRETIIL